MISTALGEEICRRATEVERSFAQAEASLQRAVRAGWRTVRVTPECYTGYHWLPAVLGPLKREFPEIDVRLVPEATREPELALRAGRIDIAIVTEALAPKKKAVKQEELFSCPLFDDELVVALAPEHPLARKKFVQPEDFLNEHLLVYDPRPEGNLFRLLIPAGVRPAKVTVVPLTEATVGLVKAGVGIAVLARWALTPHLVTGTIQGLPLGPRGLRRRWRMLALADDVDNSDGFVRRFVELLRAHGPIAESK
jgi:LysR family transcriptional regulator, regulator for metE and metH